VASQPGKTGRVGAGGGGTALTPTAVIDLTSPSSGAGRRQRRGADGGAAPIQTAAPMQAAVATSASFVTPTSATVFFFKKTFLPVVGAFYSHFGDIFVYLYFHVLTTNLFVDQVYSMLLLLCLLLGMLLFVVVIFYS
jgi:hypothetical protein